MEADLIRNTSIDVIILCGGLGTRLKPLFPNVPKTLVKIRNKPFLDILLENIISYRFRNIVLCTGYLKEQIKDHFSNYRENSNITFSEEKEPLGTGGALKNAQSLITNDNFLVLNGDSICEIDFNDLEKFHTQKNSLISIVLSKNVLEDDLQYGFVDIDDQQRIISFNEKSFKKEKLINAGIYMMNKKIFNYISNYNAPLSLEYDLFPKLISNMKNKCFGFITESELIDIGTPERYKNAINMMCDK